MPLHGPVDHLEPGVLHQVAKLVDRLDAGIRHVPLSGPAWEELAEQGGPGFAAAWADAGDDRDDLVAYAQATRTATEDRWVAEVLVDPGRRRQLVDLGAPLLARVVQATQARTDWWVSDPTPAHRELAARVGLRPHRVLHQMRRPLPVEGSWDVPLRAFVPGQDEDAFLEVNRRAFANHPDQGQMTRAQLEERMREPWFDPAGFLLCELDGRLAGFCWTKVFADLVPPMGEIHIIGVDPDFAGRGLGPQLTLAGLDHLFRQGVREGVLFVEGDNEAALAMYRRFGFRVTRTDHSYVADPTGVVDGGR